MSFSISTWHSLLCSEEENDDNEEINGIPYNTFLLLRVVGVETLFATNITHKTVKIRTARKIHTKTDVAHVSLCYVSKGHEPISANGQSFQRKTERVYVFSPVRNHRLLPKKRLLQHLIHQ